MDLKHLKYKTPFIYEIGHKFYVLGLHTCQEYTYSHGIKAFKEFVEAGIERKKKAFEHVIDCESFAKHIGNVEDFIKKLSDSDKAQLQEQFDEYCHHQGI